MSGWLFDDMDEKTRGEMMGSLNRRWGKLSQIERDSAAEGLKYLLFVNSGAAVALVAFLEARAKTDIGQIGCHHLYSGFAALVFFIAGIILIGGFRVMFYKTARSMLHSWMRNVKAFQNNKMTNEEFYSADEAEARDPQILMWLSGGSFACFIIGAIISSITVYYAI